MSEKTKIEEKTINLFESITAMKNKKLYKRKDWGRGKHLKFEKDVIYVCDGSKSRNIDGEITWKYDIWENTQAELLANDYVEFKED